MIRAMTVQNGDRTARDERRQRMHEWLARQRRLDYEARTGRRLTPRQHHSSSGSLQT
jgi:hypothetical protein